MSTAPTAIPFLFRPDDVTPGWLTDVLRAAGAADTGRVESFDAVPIGTGQVGDCVRFTLSWDSDGAGPGAVVGKFPAADETSRTTATAVRTYEVESRFYQSLRDRVDISAPVPYLALFEPESHDFVLILNDLAPAEQGDQIAGCTPDEAALAVAEAAKLHAPVWDDGALLGQEWLARNDPAAMAGLIRMLWPGFCERYAGRLDPEVEQAGATLIDRLEDALARRSGPLTVVHGDYRLDNMLFDPNPGGTPVTVVDWQTTAVGIGASDVAYFCGTGLDPALRAEVERDLVREYHDTLRAGGVRDLSFDACWEQYRRSGFAGFVMAVISSMIVGQTDRGDEMFMAMANRSGRMALDLDTLSLI